MGLLLVLAAGLAMLLTFAGEPVAVDKTAVVAVEACQRVVTPVEGGEDMASLGLQAGVMALTVPCAPRPCTWLLPCGYECGAASPSCSNSTVGI